jgi:Na+/phosphate symporter
VQGAERRCGVDIGDIRNRAFGMADIVSEILGLIERGFMENKESHLSESMKKEELLNESEQALTREILSISRSADNKRELAALAQAVETFERMGDEASGLVERIEVKVAEKLLFDETSVNQFMETYGAMRKSVDMMRDFLKYKDSSIKQRVVDNGFRVKELVERYRKEQADRLVQGVGTPLGANMYFDMLDFTGNLARHSSNVVKLF